MTHIKISYPVPPKDAPGCTTDAGALFDPRLEVAIERVVEGNFASLGPWHLVGRRWVAVVNCSSAARKDVIRAMKVSFGGYVRVV